MEKEQCHLHSKMIRINVLVPMHATFVDRYAHRMDPNSILMSPKTELGLEMKILIYCWLLGFYHLAIVPCGIIEILFLKSCRPNVFVTIPSMIISPSNSANLNMA